MNGASRAADEAIVERSKFEVGGQASDIDAGDVPGSYGENRITAMIRDPNSAYLYWEITDEGIASARGRLGEGGAQGWRNLRVYDTTGCTFDGTNAHDYFDVRVERTDREHYLMIRRPASSMHAEIGIKTFEGFFQPIARSGRADFPRSDPSPNASLEWMNVTSEVSPPCVAPCRSRYAGPEPPLPGRHGAGYFDAWRAAYTPSNEPAHPPGQGSSTTARSERHLTSVERWWHVDEWRAEWRAAPRFWRWEHFDPRRIAVDFLGGEPAHVTFEGGEMILFGPWRVTVRAFDTSGGRRVLSSWSMRSVRATTPVIERWERLAERRVLSGWERAQFRLGGSESRGLLDRGASELLRLGASERLWLGASEWVAAGASETVWLGASETRWLGASQLVFVGASGWPGASERAAASGGAWSQQWAGASESLGASEHAGGDRTPRPSAAGTVAEKWALRPEES